MYNVGDRVWWAKCGTIEVKEPCCVCFGKLTVTLILGNGDEVVLPCDYCRHGLNLPTGYTAVYRFVAEPIEVVIHSVSIVTTSNSLRKRSTIEYNHKNCILYPDIVFDTLEEATQKCAEIIEAKELEEINKPKHKQLKSYSWNAGYHMKLVERAEHDMEYHSKMAVLCKERSRL